jgi:hypothetical protein
MTFPLKLEKHPVSMNASIDGPDSATFNGSSETNNTNSSGIVAVPSGSKKRYMIIDETKLPKDEAERLLTKRAYNRHCAERARKRSKETVQELLQQVQELYADKVELRRTLAAKEMEIKSLVERNNALLLTTLTQVVDHYPHNNNSIGYIRSTEIASPFQVDSLEQLPLSAMSILQRRGSGVRIMGNSPSHDISTSFLPSWYHH